MGPGDRMPGSEEGYYAGPTGRSAAQTYRPSVSSDEPKYDPLYRARVSKAKSILCYYDDQTTFHHFPFETQEGAPTPQEMWCAQVALWIQEDVVEALASLNREAANRVADTDACVEHVPVKRLVLVRVLGYDTSKPEGRFNFPTEASRDMPSGAGGPSPTGRKCNEQYDVVRFVVSVIVDQRELLRLIDRLSQANFYQCLGVRYEAVDHESEAALGYFYGTAPVVKATLECEAYMLREIYEPLMPTSVREMLGIGGAGRKDED